MRTSDGSSLTARTPKAGGEGRDDQGNTQALRSRENTAPYATGIHPGSPAQGQGNSGKAQKSRQKLTGGLRGLCEGSQGKTTPSPLRVGTYTQTSAGKENFPPLSFQGL